MMWWTGAWSWGWGVAMVAGMLLVSLAVAWAIATFVRLISRRRSAEDIVEERFAAGQLTEEQYRAMIAALHGYPVGSRH